MLRSAPVSDFCKSSLFQKTSPESACPLERKDVNCFSKDKSCLNACFCLLINRNTSWPLHLCSHCRAASIKLNADYKPFQPHFKNTFTKKISFLVAFSICFPYSSLKSTIIRRYFVSFCKSGLLKEL